MEDVIPLTNITKSPKKATRISKAYGDSVSAFRFSRITKHSRVFQTVWQDANLVTKSLRGHTGDIGIHLAFFIGLTAAIAGNYYLDLEMATVTLSQFCGPGGEFDFLQTYNPWAVEHAFQITLGFGSMTFAQAKAADIVWDAVVGRGGQIILVAICFHAFSKSLNRMLEQPNSSVPFHAFRAIIFENPSLSSIYSLVRGFGSLVGWQSKISMLWMITASIYVAAFPTMTSAMTGYSAIMIPYFNDTDFATPLSDNNIFHRAIYRINDAHRIEGLGLGVAYIVGSQGFVEGWNETTADEDYYDCLDSSATEQPSLRDCYLVQGISDYITRYGSESSQKTATTLSVNQTTYDIQSPSLSITIFNTTSFPDSGTNLSVGNNPGHTPLAIEYTTTNDSATYDTETINKSLGMCIPQDTYQWGFSFILLFSFLSITSVWMLGMYVLWNDAFWNSKLDRAGREMGFYRGVVDISDAIRKNTLEDIGPLAAESEIRAMITRKPYSGRIRVDEIHHDQLPSPRRDAIRGFSRSVPSLRGWTRSWMPLHWVWFIIFVAIGLAWAFIPIALSLENTLMLDLATIISFIAVGILWLMTIIMLLTAIPGLTQYWYHVPVLSKWFEPRTISYWALTVAFTIFGLYGFYGALLTGYNSTYYGSNSSISFDNDFLLDKLLSNTIDNMSLSVSIVDSWFAGAFWLVAAVMFFVGLCSTLYRWGIWLKHAASRSHQGHKAVPSVDSTSYSAF